MKNTTKAYLQRKINEEMQSIEKAIYECELTIELLQALTTRTKKDGKQFANFSQNFENKFTYQNKVGSIPRFNFSGKFIGYELKMSAYMTNRYINGDLYIDCQENDVQAVLTERDKKINYHKQCIIELNYQKDNLQRIFDEIIAPFIDSIEQEESNGYRYLSFKLQELLRGV